MSPSDTQAPLSAEERLYGDYGTPWTEAEKAVAETFCGEWLIDEEAGSNRSSTTTLTRGSALLYARNALERAQARRALPSSDPSGARTREEMRAYARDLIGLEIIDRNAALKRYSAEGIALLAEAVRLLREGGAPASAPGAGEAELREALDKISKLPMCSPRGAPGSFTRGQDTGHNAAVLSAAKIARAALAARSPFATASGGGEDKLRAALLRIVERDDMASELFTNDKDRADCHADEARLALRPAQNPQPEGETVEGRS